jgi:hypothetical protein
MQSCSNIRPELLYIGEIHLPMVSSTSPVSTQAFGPRACEIEFDQ